MISYMDITYMEIHLSMGDRFSMDKNQLIFQIATWEIAGG
jgi:hypothetical protein